MTLRVVPNGTGGRSDGSESDPDKRRNKLGYQRISIACAHCRRRKIRCVVNDNEPSHKCVNCIRLRRDCQFYPVDQAHLSSSQRSGRSQRSSTASTSSSRGSGGDEGSAHGRELDVYARHPHTVGRPQTYPGLVIEPNSSIHSAGHVNPEYEYRPSTDDYLARYNAPTRFHPATGSDHAQNGADPYWRATENSVIGGYGPIIPDAQSAMRLPHPPAAVNGPTQPAPPWQQNRAQSPRGSMYHAPVYQENTIGNSYTYAPAPHPDPGALAGPVRHNSVTYPGSTGPMGYPSERVRAASDAAAQMNMVYGQINGGHVQPQVTNGMLYASQPAYAGPWYDNTTTSDHINHGNHDNGHNNGHGNHGTMPPGMYAPRSG